jgi:hypothetical protein
MIVACGSTRLLRESIIVPFIVPVCVDLIWPCAKESFSINKNKTIIRRIDLLKRVNVL